MLDDGESLIDDVAFDNVTWESDYGLANGLANGLADSGFGNQSDLDDDVSVEEDEATAENPYEMLYGYADQQDDSGSGNGDDFLGVGGHHGGGGGGGGGRVFQAFWCGDQEAEEEQLPKPDNYGIRSSQAGCRKKRRPVAASIAKRCSRVNLFDDFIANSFAADDERRSKTNDDDELSAKPVHYAPKRPPPILDFIFVLTSFIVAVVMAYYSAV